MKYNVSFLVRLSEKEDAKLFYLCEMYKKKKSDLIRYCLNYFYSTVNKKSGNKIIKDEFAEQINILNRELENINKKLNAINERFDRIENKNITQMKNFWNTVKKLITLWGIEVFFTEKILRRVFREQATNELFQESKNKAFQMGELIMSDAPPRKQSAAKNNPVKGKGGGG